MLHKLCWFKIFITHSTTIHDLKMKSSNSFFRFIYNNVYKLFLDFKHFITHCSAISFQTEMIHVKTKCWMTCRMLLFIVTCVQTLPRLKICIISVVSKTFSALSLWLSVHLLNLLSEILPSHLCFILNSLLWILMLSSMLWDNSFSQNFSPQITFSMADKINPLCKRFVI